MKVYKSTYHPGHASAALVYARSLVKPLGYCMLPLMVFASLSVLSGIDALTLVSWGGPIAYLLASAWTLYTVRGTVAEIIVRDGSCAVRTVWDVALKKRDLNWWYILGVNVGSEGLLVTVGRTVYALQQKDWPSYPQLRMALNEAATLAQFRSRY